MIYFATYREANLVKIGRAIYPLERVKMLQCGSPVPLRLEAQIEAPNSLERELHARFAKHRSHGEWFMLCPEMEELIAANPVPDALAIVHMTDEQIERVGREVEAAVFAVFEQAA